MVRSVAIRDGRLLSTTNYEPACKQIILEESQSMRLNVYVRDDNPKFKHNWLSSDCRAIIFRDHVLSEKCETFGLPKSASSNNFDFFILLHLPLPSMRTRCAQTVTIVSKQHIPLLREARTDKKYISRFAKSGLSKRYYTAQVICQHQLIQLNLTYFKTRV